MVRRLLCFLCCCATMAVSAETLKIATVSPEGSSWMKIMRAGAEQLKAESGGRVTLKFYTGGVMGDDKAVLRKIRANQLQGAALTAGSLTSVYTDVQLYNLPLVFHSYDEVDYVRAQLDARIEGGIEKKGFEVLGFSEAGFAYAMSTAAATDVDKASSQRVWVPDADPGAMVAVKAFGIQPMALTLIDVLPMLQTGNVQAVAMPPIAVIAFQWHPYLKYVLDLPLVYSFGTLVVDQRAFGKLSAADQALTRKIMGKAMKDIDAGSRRDHFAAIAALEKQGLKKLTPSATELAGWRARGDAAVKAVVQQGQVTQEAFDALQTLLKAKRQQG